jgi:hypothetical protein
LENTEGAIKTGQSRETGNIGYTRRRQTKQKHKVSLDCPFMIAPSVFSNVNLLTIVKLRSIYNVDNILRIVRQCLECRNYSEMLILSRLIMSRLDRNYSHY